MTKFFGIERAVERIGAVVLLSQAILLGVATATVGAPIWA